MKHFTGAVALFVVLVCGSVAESQTLRIGIYFTEHVEADEVPIRTALAQSGVHIGAIIIPAFFKKAPIATELITGTIEGRRKGSRTIMSGVLGDETLYAFERSPDVHKDLVDIDFLIVLTPTLLFEEPTRSSYDWSNGLARTGGITTLVYYGTNVDSESLEYTILHEFGHLLGLPHTNMDLCGTINYLMCARLHVIEETAIVKRLRDGNIIEFATVTKVLLKPWVLDERYKTALENHLKRKPQ